MTKICSCCGIEKTHSEFYTRKSGNKLGQLRQPCVECALAQKSKEYADNPKSFRERRQARRKKDPEKIRAAERKTYAKHKSKNNIRQRLKYAEDRERAFARQRRYRAKPGEKQKQQALARCLRSRILGALNGRDKAAPSIQLLGCSIAKFRAYLESQFSQRPGMSWETRCFWEIDHIIPCAEFHLQHSEEQEICFHFSNQRPVWTTENRKKSNRIL